MDIQIYLVTVIFGVNHPRHKYLENSSLLWGDPIGRALFALSVDEAARGIQSEANVCIWTDATLPSETPRRGFKTI